MSWGELLKLNFPLAKMMGRHVIIHLLTDALSRVIGMFLLVCSLHKKKKKQASKQEVIYCLFEGKQLYREKLI